MNSSKRVFCKKIVIICPVRNAVQEIQGQVKKYVRTLERAGHTVHWPPRDNDQSDPVGTRICSQMRRAMKDAHEVHIWYDPESQGTLFDIGMLFAFLLESDKKVIIINRDQVKVTSHKSFQNVLLELAKE